MEDNRADLVKLKVEEVTKQRNFFWDSFILSIALFISSLSFSSIIGELFSDENSVECLIKLDNRNQYNFINSYCHKDISSIKYFPVIVLSQSALLLAPHYAWKVIISAKFESFLSHAAKVEILREKNTGKYPYHNYTIVKYLRREFSDSYNFSLSYIFKLVVQITSVIASFAINIYVFENISDMDITFKCKDEDQLFCQLFDNVTMLNVNNVNKVNNVTCVYPSKVVINVLVWIDYVLIALAFVMLIYGLRWASRNHSQKHNGTIADFCYSSCIDPQYCYKLSKGSNFLRGCFKIRDDFTFLLASLHSGYRRVFRTILIEDIISRKFSERSQQFVQGN